VSGATIGSIYHFFPGGKEALAVAVIETTGAVHRQLFESIAAEAADPASALRDVLMAAGRHVAQLAERAITQAAPTPAT